MVLLTEDVISGIVKAVCTLPDKAAEEISQEMVLRSLWGNTDLKV